jgi:predicted MPP superfamily phosphohydrolase
MTNKILRLPLDTNKRHFIVGDTHGKYETFLNLLKEADYDEDNDIIYSVGDNIDRGPKSYEMIKYFTTMPNAYTIMGNHEYMMKEDSWLDVWLNNGGYKCLGSLRENGKDHQWLKEQVKDFPWVIEVGDEDEENAFRIVHADYDPLYTDETANQILTNAVDDDGNFDGDNNNIQSLIWGRSTITDAMYNLSILKPLTHEMEFNPDRKRHNYVGHTPINKITTVKDITFLDTWGSNGLSMIEAISGEKYTTPMVDL